jgi:CheY-like chemotaxis protein
MSTEELMDELGISLRQLRREEKRAFEALTTLLWDQFRPLLASSGEPLAPDEGTALTSPTQTETQQFLAGSESSNVDLKQILDGVLETLTPLLQQRRPQVVLEEKGAPLAILADRVAMRQAVLSTLLQALAGLSGGRLSIGLDYEHSNWVALDVHAGPYDAVVSQGEDRLAMSRDLVLKQGGRFETYLSGTLWHTRIEMPTARERFVVLAIDDNENLIELFRRYTAGTSYRIVSARGGQEALLQVRRSPPHLITLDVMMPQRDGWEILQHLRTQPQLADVPIIICSVVNEPGLATMLGASDFLPKPVTQDALLSMLGKWAAHPPY